MLSSGEPIPSGDNIARWCRESSVKQSRITSEAFFPRKNENYLSGNWLECFSPDPDTAMELLIASLTTLCLNERQRFVRLKVEDITSSILENGGSDPSVVFRPEPDNPCHVAISWGNWPHMDQVFAAALLLRALANGVYPAVDPSPES